MPGCLALARSPASFLIVLWEISVVRPTVQLDSHFQLGDLGVVRFVKPRHAPWGRYEIASTPRVSTMSRRVGRGSRGCLGVERGKLGIEVVSGHALVLAVLIRH